MMFNWLWIVTEHLLRYSDIPMTQPFNLPVRTGSWQLHYGVPSTPYGCSFTAWSCDRVHGSHRKLSSGWDIFPGIPGVSRPGLTHIVSVSRHTDSRSRGNDFACLVPVLRIGVWEVSSGRRKDTPGLSDTRSMGLDSSKFCFWAVSIFSLLLKIDFFFLSE
jgi:hypothetical protein